MHTYSIRELITLVIFTSDCPVRHNGYFVVPLRPTNLPREKLVLGACLKWYLRMYVSPRMCQDGTFLARDSLTSAAPWKIECLVLRGKRIFGSEAQSFLSFSFFFAIIVQYRSPRGISSLRPHTPHTQHDVMHSALKFANTTYGM